MTDRREIDAFLFGRLSEAERTAVEERFFADDAFASDVLEREDDLLDALAADGLPAADAQALTARLVATPEGARRVRFARAWHAASRPGHAVDASSREDVDARQGRWTGWAGAAASLVLAVAAGTLAVQNARLRSQLDGRAVAAPPVSPVSASPTPEAGSGAVRVVLTGTRTRGSGDVPVVALPPDAAVVHLVVPSPDPSSVFDVRVETSPGGELIVDQRRARRTAGQDLDLWVSASQLPAGDYELLLTVDGAPDPRLVGQYAFRVQRAGQ